MPRLTADVDLSRWVPVTESFGIRGRRHRKAALKVLLGQANAALGRDAQTGRFAAWGMSQVMPLIMRKAAGRVLVWVYKSDPELVSVMATVQEATREIRVMRASQPMEYDDTEDFRHPTLGTGEKLVLSGPEQPVPRITYTWDLGTHFVVVTAVSGDANRLGTVIDQVDEVARRIRLVDDVALGESANVLRLDP